MDTKVLYISYMGLSEPLIESQALSYLRGLSRKGNLIYILSFEKKRIASKGRIDEIKKDLSKNGIKWILLRYHKRPLFLAKAVDLLLGLIFTFYIVLAKGIEIIHARGTMPAIFSLPVAKSLRRKFVFDMRGLMAMEYADGNIWKEGSFYFRFVDGLEKIILRYADSVVMLTERIKDITGSSFYTGVDIRRKISIIPTSVNTELFNIKRNGSDDNIRRRMGLKARFVFLYVGSIGTWYMLKEMAEFIKINRFNFKEPFFLVVTQAEKEKVEEILRRSGFKDDDYAVVYSEHDEIPAYINSADAAMMFIKPCASKVASSPTKFAEYLACGAPVVLNAGIGDCDRIIRDCDTGVLVQAFDRDNYLSSGLALKRIVEGGGSVSRRCREAAIKEFSLNKAIDDYNKIYKKLKKGEV